MILEEELDRVRVVGDDGSWLIAIEFRLVTVKSSPRGDRREIGRRAWRLSTGEPLTIVDRDNFEMPETGELLRRADTE
ncbi:hypothetical protein PX554_17555 [Sphingomonas sp. H39-1-10]|uniref:hypothetical protein n=1 Tax=Sphingomonas TaxID=13687 RepID=UPI000886E1B6|nr:MULTISPECIES: hypothetical protein [Sphingomonas]MDF0489945.1 hypothetical protein [Sphingomonas pollutisoli]SDA36936.1 hypothetical protein SAMN03159340_04043 [Sphingomonas sp. NFR15]